MMASGEIVKLAYDLIRIAAPIGRRGGDQDLYVVADKN
jgi:hypothetical protein